MYKTHSAKAEWLLCAFWYLCTYSLAVYMPLSRLLDHRPASGSTIASLPFHAVVWDCIFSVAVVIYLFSSEWYGKRYFPNAYAYPGAFRTASGDRRNPYGFITYLPFAFLLSFATPFVVFLYVCVVSSSITGAASVLLGYLVFFSVQIALEVKYFNRKHMTSSIPFAFGLYRFWQLIRGTWYTIVLMHASEAGGKTDSASWHHDVDTSWHMAGSIQAADDSTTSSLPDSVTNILLVRYTLITLLCFWVFDHAVTATLLPWMLNGQLATMARKHVRTN